jgi:hypothetical protein
MLLFIAIYFKWSISICAIGEKIAASYHCQKKTQGQSKQ